MPELERIGGQVSREILAVLSAQGFSIDVHPGFAGGLHLVATGDVVAEIYGVPGKTLYELAPRLANEVARRRLEALRERNEQLRLIEV